MVYDQASAVVINFCRLRVDRLNSGYHRAEALSVRSRMLTTHVRTRASAGRRFLDEVRDGPADDGEIQRSSTIARIGSPHPAEIPTEIPSARSDCLLSGATSGRCYGQVVGRGQSLRVSGSSISESPERRFRAASRGLRRAAANRSGSDIVDGCTRKRMWLEMIYSLRMTS